MIRRTPIEVFLSYSHKDEDLRNALGEHLSVLQRENWITVWHDRKITPGGEWKGQIDTRLLSAQMILLLVSPSFMASDYCYDIELKKALERHETEGIEVIPIMLRPVDWHLAPFSHLQALPRDARPVTEWPDRDVAFREIAIALRRICEGGPAPDRSTGALSEPARVQVRPGPRAPATWVRILMTALVLTLLSSVYFRLNTPTAPLDAPGIVVVFGAWAVVCYGLERALSVLRGRHRSPKNTNGAQ